MRSLVRFYWFWDTAYQPSYCTPCLNALHHGGTLRCPLCRAVTKFPDASKPSITDLPLNYAIQKIQDILRHSKRKLLMCSEHNFEEVKFYCQECDTLLCAECMVERSCEDNEKSHKDHEIVTVKHAAVNLYHQIKMKQSEAFDLVRDLTNITNELNLMKHNLDNNAAGLKKMVQNEFNEVIRLALERRAVVMREIEEIHESKSKGYHETIDLISVSVKALKDVGKKCDDLLATHSSITQNDTASHEKRPNSPIQSPPASPAFERRASCVSTKDVVSLWQDGPNIRDQLKEALDNAFPAVEYGAAVKPEYISCSCTEEKAKINEIISRLGSVKVTSEPATAFQMFVKSHDGKTFVLRLAPWENRVIDVMTKVEACTRVPVAKQRLYHQGKLLYVGHENGNETEWVSLSDFNIENESTIHLNVSLG